VRIATGKSELITVKYTVQTERPFVAVPFIDPKRAFIRPTRIFIYPEGGQDLTVLVEIGDHP